MTTAPDINAVRWMRSMLLDFDGTAQRLEDATWRARKTVRGARLHAAHESLQDNGRQHRWPLLWESVATEWVDLVNRMYR